MIHPKFQPYSKTIEQIKRQERMEMGRRTPKGIQRTQREDNESTSSLSTEKERKIQSANGCFRSYYRRSAIPETRGKVEINSISIKNDASGRKKL